MFDYNMNVNEEFGKKLWLLHKLFFIHVTILTINLSSNLLNMLFENIICLNLLLTNYQTVVWYSSHGARDTNKLMIYFFLLFFSKKELGFPMEFKK